MIYIANNFLETEIQSKTASALEDNFHPQSIPYQLQYLPLLFLNEEDTVLISEMPTHNYLSRLKNRGLSSIPKMELLSDFRMGDKKDLKSWAASQLVEKWALEHQLNYAMPSLSSAAQVNSKLYQFKNNPQLPFSKIILCKDDLTLNPSVDKWVLKNDQGYSGKGLCVFRKDQKDKALNFCERQKGDALILEPWVERLFDFSSQWYMDKDGGLTLLGVTKCLNHSSGQYRGSVAGPKAKVFDFHLELIENHIEYCQVQFLNFKNGFWGHFGVDAMIYLDTEKKPQLHPVVEVNARMTMSCACLLFQQRYFPSKVLEWSMIKNNNFENSLLPDSCKYQLSFVFI